VVTPEDLAMCPGGEIRSAMARTRGRVTFDGAIATRSAETEVDAEIFVPRICTIFAGGCDAIEANLRMSTPDTDCSLDAASNCVCMLHQVSSFMERVRYSTTATQIVFATGRRWNYCIRGDEMTYRDVSTRVTPEGGVIELGRR
jgi:hypothetical protein